MEFIAKQNYLRLSPTKIRPVVGLIKKLTPDRAVATLPFIEKRASLPLKKVIAAALASAKEKGVASSELVFKQIQVTEGPRLKRGIAVSRGRWHPIIKRMSHIRVVLATKAEPATKTGDQKTASASVEVKPTSEKIKKTAQVKKADQKS